MGSVNKTIAARPHIPAAVADLWSVCSSTGRNSVQIRPRRVESKVYSHTRSTARIKDHGWGGRAALVFQADCVEKKKICELVRVKIVLIRLRSILTINQRRQMEAPSLLFQSDVMLTCLRSGSALTLL